MRGSYCSRGVRLGDSKFADLPAGSTAAHSEPPGCGAPESLSGHAATGERIRCSKADSAALAPSPAAMMICLKGTVVASPAA
mgnify:CR=1 FL=1